VAVEVEDALTEVEVETAFGLGVEEAETGTNINVFVGLGNASAVPVVEAMLVGDTVGGAADVPTVAVARESSADTGICVPVEIEAPGVRKLSIQAGLVRMDGSTGSMNFSGLRVRKSLFGSSLDSTLTSSSQWGLKRSAHLPASRSARSPNKRMSAMTVQSRLSFSVALMGKSIKRQTHMDRCAWTQLLVIARAFDPNTSVVRVGNASRNGKTQTWTTALEFGLAG